MSDPSSQSCHPDTDRDQGPVTGQIDPSAGAVDYLHAWLTGGQAGIVIVHSDLRVIWSNPVAGRLEPEGVRFEQGRLSIRDSDTTNSLLAFVNQLGPAAAAWVAPASSGAHLIVRGDPSTPPGHPPAVALTFRVSSDPESWVWADLRQALGLTRAEVAIVKRLLGGDCAEDIAANTPVTLETVRTHIRRMYLKLNVGNREQLFARVLQYRIG